MVRVSDDQDSADRTKDSVDRTEDSADPVAVIPEARSAPADPVPAEPAPPGWLCTGLHWAAGRPTLAAVDGDSEWLRVLTPGEPLRLCWGGPRRCVGWFAPATGRTACPYAAEISASAKLAQCGFCQSRDHGLAVARDRITDDGRTYRLYLAWFAPGMLKVGITAEQRGDARLLEQGAIGYTVIATGSLPAVRRAELTVSSTGLARERYRASAKVEAWWQLPEPAGLAAALENGRAKALRTLADHDLATVPDGPIIDNHLFFSLADGAPPAYDEVEALADAGHIVADTGPVIGKHLFLTPTGPPPGSSHRTDRPTLLDLRLLAGWSVAAVEAAEETSCAGLRVVERRRPLRYEMETLF
jgi:hypothetical protein